MEANVERIIISVSIIVEEGSDSVGVWKEERLLLMRERKKERKKVLVFFVFLRERERERKRRGYVEWYN